jgi:hypothetical protein
LLSLSLLSLSLNDSNIPVFTFYVYSTTTDAGKPEARNNFFGEEVAALESVLDQNYKIVNSEAGILTAGSSYQLRKPELYSTIEKLKRYYKKQIKKDHSKLNELSEKYARVLSVANAIVTADTQEFEAVLKEESSIETISEIFCRTVLIYE